MARVAVVQHNPEVPPGRLVAFLSGHDVTTVWAEQDEFPRDVDAAVVLGGFMGAYDTDRYPWLTSEKAWLADLVEKDVPVLGICLGAQLLADALGGKAFRSPRPEVGVLDLVLTQAGAAHPLWSRLDGRGFFSHQDTFVVPPGATLLAETADYPAVFEVGSALAIQHHPEARYEHVASWVAHPRYKHLAAVGMTAEELLEDVADFDKVADVTAASLFGAWFAELAE